MDRDRDAKTLRETEFDRLLGQISEEKERNGEIFFPDTSFMDAAFLYSEDGIIREINKNLSSWIQVPTKDIIGKHINWLNDYIDLDFLLRKDLLQTILRQRTYIRHSGKTAVAHCFPLFDDLLTSVNVVILRDFSDTGHITEELLAANDDHILQSAPAAISKDGVFGSSLKSLHLTNQISAIANTNASILLVGETGVGKEHVAKTIFKYGNRSNAAFISVNCATIPDELFESEFYGYEKGAFTGGLTNGKCGYFEAADKGILFLDEIGELPLKHQPKLLRVLQTGEFFRVGGSKQYKTDIRIIAATNKDLDKLVADGLFRADLYYRISTITIKPPPLRERAEDIPLFVKYFLDIANRKYASSKEISFDAVSALASYSWPGNIRELRNVIERLVILSPGNISASDVDAILKLDQNKTDSASYRSQLETFQRGILSAALQKYGSTYKAAESIGMSQSAFYRAVRKLGLM